MSALPPTSPGPGSPSVISDAGARPGPIPSAGGWLGEEYRPPFPGTEHLNAAEVFGTPGYQAPHVRTPRVAVASVILGVLSVIPFVGIAAFIVGTVGVRKLRMTMSSALSMSWFGVVLGAASTIGWVWMWWLILTMRAG